MYLPNFFRKKALKKTLLEKSPVIVANIPQLINSVIQYSVLILPPTLRPFTELLYI